MSLVTGTPLAATALPKATAAGDAGVAAPPLSVLIYAKAFAPMVGGLERITGELAAGLAARGVVVTVATEARGDALSGPGYPIVRRPGLRGLWRLIGNADVLHLAGPALLPLILARLRRRPVVVLHHTYQAICPAGNLLELPKREPCPGHFQARRYGKCLRCVAVDHGRVTSWWRLLAAVPRTWLLRRAVQAAPSAWAAARFGAHVSTVPHGLDLATEAAASPQAARAAQAPANTIPTVVYVGRLVREKGVDTLISALAVLRYAGRELRLKLIGDGPERSALLTQATLLGVADAVTFVGRVPPPLVARELADATVQALPSRCGETFGLVALEALARGTPLIVTDLGGQAEVAGDAAVCVPPNHVRAMAEAIAALIDDPERRAALAVAGHVRAAAFSPKAMLDAHMHLLAQAAAQRYPKRREPVA